jgi:hypothetical protein
MDPVGLTSTADNNFLLGVPNAVIPGLKGVRKEFEKRNPQEELYWKKFYAD